MIVGPLRVTMPDPCAAGPCLPPCAPVSSTQAPEHVMPASSRQKPTRPAVSASMAVMAVASLAVASLTLTACRNPCQQLCVEIRDYAARECGLQFSDAEFDQCIADHRGGSLEKEQRSTCREGLGDVAKEWDCNEVEAYFSELVGDGGAQGDSGVSAQ